MPSLKFGPDVDERNIQVPCFVLSSFVQSEQNHARFGPHLWKCSQEGVRGLRSCRVSCKGRHRAVDAVCFPELPFWGSLACSYKKSVSYVWATTSLQNSRTSPKSVCDHRKYIELVSTLDPLTSCVTQLGHAHANFLEPYPCLKNGENTVVILGSWCCTTFQRR